MLVEIKRFEFKPNYTIGKLYIDGQYECYTLEDAVRDTKIQDVTAIPTGEYKLVIDVSTRFKKFMPHILDVPNFTGVRIHSGNTSKDTEGCILLGKSWLSGDFIGNSKAAYNDFFNKLKEAKEATIKIC
jgi:hypothetical protein